MSLGKKIAEIRRELHNIEKRGRNDFHKYDYVMASDLQGVLGTMLAEKNVIVGRRNVKIDRGPVPTKEEETWVLIQCDYVLIDTESQEEFIYASAGEGRDKGDKAIFKAWTGCMKYFLIQAFSLAMGDDPEADERKPPKSEEQIPIRHMVNKIQERFDARLVDQLTAASMPSKAGRPEVNDVSKDRTGLIVVPDRVPPPESAIAKTLTPAQAEAMLKMLKLSADAGHNIGNWLAVWGLPTDGAEQLSKSPSIEGNVYAAMARMTQEKGKERFLKARDHYVPKDKREGLVWPE